MKKILTSFLVGLAFAACSSQEDNSAETKDALKDAEWFQRLSFVESVKKTDGFGYVEKTVDRMPIARVIFYRDHILALENGNDYATSKDILLVFPNKNRAMDFYRRIKGVAAGKTLEFYLPKSEHVHPWQSEVNYNETRDGLYYYAREMIVKDMAEKVVYPTDLDMIRQIYDATTEAKTGLVDGAIGGTAIAIGRYISKSPSQKVKYVGGGIQVLGGIFIASGAKDLFDFVWDGSGALQVVLKHKTTGEAVDFLTNLQTKLKDAEKEVERLEKLQEK